MRPSVAVYPYCACFFGSARKQSARKQERRPSSRDWFWIRNRVPEHSPISRRHPRTGDPVALYLLLTGSWIKAVILVGWGMLAVGMIDNLLYPFLVGDKLRLHTVPTFFSILGGDHTMRSRRTYPGSANPRHYDRPTGHLVDAHVRKVMPPRQKVTENNQTKIPPGKVSEKRRVQPP